MQRAQSNDPFGFACHRSYAVIGGTKMKARTPVHSRTNATVMGFNDAFGRRYSDILDVVNAAKELAATDVEDR
jgi:hypothetical protein